MSFTIILSFNFGSLHTEKRVNDFNRSFQAIPDPFRSVLLLTVPIFLRTRSKRSFFRNDGIVLDRSVCSRERMIRMTRNAPSPTWRDIENSPFCPNCFWLNKQITIISSVWGGHVYTRSIRQGYLLRITKNRLKYHFLWFWDKAFPGVMRGPTKRLGSIGLAVLTFVHLQIKKQTPKQSTLLICVIMNA